ncbi:hypothetical protein ROLI_020260 [Roseobacter fucihabitans]|uniref:Uncharacterized protein n=1 Tax=Roseobacter fucihabitans TaxID=1537242 RepID=A0ABZ2BUT9_9RHOB|nr:hypothetical protein [Roseobacter litoralis]
MSRLDHRFIDLGIRAAATARVQIARIRGDINGSWKRLSASGEWKNYTNAYQQAVVAKNSVRDAMQLAKPVGSFYPDGYVVFTNPIPEGSEIIAPCRLLDTVTA